MSLHTCRSGRHHWSASADAEKCCNPAWQRVLLVGWDAFRHSETPLVAESSTVYGRAWVPVEKSEELA